MELVTLVTARVRRWIRFVGPGRVAAGTGACVALLAGAVMLFAPPAPSLDPVIPPVSAAGATVPAPTAGAVRSVRVHVTGAVKKPGVYELLSNERVVDAVAAAGGATAGADLESINLAQTILDTEQIFVPRRTSAPSRRQPAPRLRPKRTTSTTRPAGETATTEAAPKTVDINSANAAQLETLPGVGPSTARAIISYRQSKGPFAKVEDLLNVPGIGPSKLDAMRSMISL